MQSCALKNHILGSNHFFKGEAAYYLDNKHAGFYYGPNILQITQCVCCGSILPSPGTTWHFPLFCGDILEHTISKILSLYQASY